MALSATVHTRELPACASTLSTSKQLAAAAAGCIPATYLGHCAHHKHIVCGLQDGVAGPLEQVAAAGGGVVGDRHAPVEGRAAVQRLNAAKHGAGARALGAWLRWHSVQRLHKAYKRKTCSADAERCCALCEKGDAANS